MGNIFNFIAIIIGSLLGFLIGHKFKESMKNIYTTSVNENTIDEAPFVYKPMQEIIDCIGDTVEVVDILKPLYNFKAS